MTALPLHVLPARTPHAPHVRDAMNLRRAMNCVVLALVPVIAVGLWNTGRQVALAGAEPLAGWRGALVDVAGLAGDPHSIAGCLLAGLVLWLPLYLVALGVGILWQRLFARARGTRAAGLTVTALLFSLALPPTIALWQVALGITFGVVVAKELFGGTGRNFLNPALAGVAFLYFGYPEAMRGEPVWVAVSGWTGQSALGLAASGGLEALRQAGVTWSDTFLGREPGAFGETSAAAALLGGALLLWVRLVSWRILAGGVAGAVVAALLVQALAPGATVPWYWHLTLGAFAFGLVFFATDPVTAATTNPGRWVYGLLIGAMTILIRVANPAHLDGAMLAILFGNVCAPLVDYGFVWANARRRARRDA